MSNEKKVLYHLLDTIQLMELPREVYAEFAREMITRLGLSLEDCFSVGETTQFLQNIREKCKDLISLTEMLPSVLALAAAMPAVPAVVREVSETGEIPLEDENGVIGCVIRTEEKPETVEKTQASACSKGYSRNGKKLGRPRKSPQPAVASEENNAAGEEEQLVDNEAPASDTANEQPKDEKREVVSVEIQPETSAADEDVLTAEELREIENLKMGREYSMDILYRWRNRMVVSNRVLQEGAPLGVFIPYNRKSVEYEKFILYVTDEIPGLPLSKASSYARSKLPAYKGERWKVLDTWQIEAAKQAQPELNRILKKIGGDPFVGSYLVPNVVNYHKMPDKIRYALNVR